MGRKDHIYPSCNGHLTFARFQVAACFMHGNQGRGTESVDCFTGSMKIHKVGDAVCNHGFRMMHTVFQRTFHTCRRLRIMAAGSSHENTCIGAPEFFPPIAGRVCGGYRCLQKQTLPGIHGGSFLRRDVEVGGIKKIDIFQEPRRNVANLLCRRNICVPSSRRCFTKAVAAGKECLPERLRIISAGKFKG